MRTPEKKKNEILSFLSVILLISVLNCSTKFLSVLKLCQPRWRVEYRQGQADQIHQSQPVIFDFWIVFRAQLSNRHNSSQDEQTHNAHVYYTQNDHSTCVQIQRQLQVNHGITFSRSRRRVKYSAKQHYALLDYLGRAGAVLERGEKAPVSNGR